MESFRGQQKKDTAFLFIALLSVMIINTLKAYPLKTNYDMFNYVI